MVVFKISVLRILIILITLEKTHGENGCVATASPEKPETCHHSQVSVPIPYKCDRRHVSIPFDCHDVENLLESNKSTKVYLDGNRIFDRSFINDCLNDTTTYSKSGHWKIELNQMANVYAVFIRTLGQENNQLNSLHVNVSRRISSDRLETIKCHDFKYSSGYHRFYCYPSKGILTSDYRLGFDTHFLIIFGNIYIDSCSLTSIVKVYSYPMRICGIPEAYHNQSYHPKTYYYLVGQQVVYKCSNESYTLVGNQSRVCQQNGLWSGETPICILVQIFEPESRLVHFKENSSVSFVELYRSATNLANATRIQENDMITYRFDNVYCINHIFMEFHSELSERTNIKLYTTSITGTRHFWSTNGSFGENANKQLYFSNAYQQYVCSLNITLQRLTDLPLLRNFPKRLEFLYKFQIRGYRQKSMGCLRPHVFPNVKFASNVNSLTEIGETVALECKEGFRPSNNEVHPAIINCNNGVWNGRFPICERQNCPLPKESAHSSWTYIKDAKNKYDKIYYKCDAGFEQKGRITATCLAGMWTNPPPICQVSFCSQITVPSNMYCMLDRKHKHYDQNGNGTFYHHGIGLNCYCLPGFHLIGNKTVQCKNKEWTSLPVCEEIFCYKPPFISSSSSSKYDIKKQWRWSIGSHNFSCPEKFIIKGSLYLEFVELVCQENGEWKEREVYECVKPSYHLTCEQVTGIVSGVSIGVAIIFVVFYFFIAKKGMFWSWSKSWSIIERKFKDKSLGTSEMNLTISENCSYIKNYVDIPHDRSFEIDEVSDSFILTDDPISSNSSDSDREIEVVL